MATCKDCDHCKGRPYTSYPDEKGTTYDCTKHTIDIGDYPNLYTCDDNTYEDKLKKINFRKVR